MESLEPTPRAFAELPEAPIAAIAALIDAAGWRRPLHDRSISGAFQDLQKHLGIRLLFFAPSGSLPGVAARCRHPQDSLASDLGSDRQTGRHCPSLSAALASTGDGSLFDTLGASHLPLENQRPPSPFLRQDASPHSPVLSPSARANSSLTHLGDTSAAYSYAIFPCRNIALKSSNMYIPRKM